MWHEAKPFTYYCKKCNLTFKHVPVPIQNPDIHQHIHGLPDTANTQLCVSESLSTLESIPESLEQDGHSVIRLSHLVVARRLL